MKNNKKKPWYKRQDPNLVYAFVLVCSVLALVLYEKNTFEEGWMWYLGVMLQGLGGSGLVAVVLAFTLEKFTRAQHEDAAAETVGKIQHNIFNAIYHRYIPDKLFQEVEKCLMQSNVYRENYSVEYYLDPTPPAGEAGEVSDMLNSLKNETDYIRCIATSEYTLVNTTDAEIVENICTHLELPLKDELKPFVQLNSFQAGSFQLHSNDIKHFVIDDEKQVHYKFERPVTLAPKERLKISMSAQMIKKKEDIELWASRIPSDGLTLTINFPPSCSSPPIVAATANHSEALEPIETHVAAKKKWRLSHGMLPFQSVIFWWKI